MWPSGEYQLYCCKNSEKNVDFMTRFVGYQVVYQKKIKAWIAQPGTVKTEMKKPNVEEQKPQISEG